MDASHRGRSFVCVCVCVWDLCPFWRGSRSAFVTDAFSLSQAAFWICLPPPQYTVVPVIAGLGMNIWKYFAYVNVALFPSSCIHPPCWQLSHSSQGLHWHSAAFVFLSVSRAIFSAFEKTSATRYIYTHTLWGICCWHLIMNNSDSYQFMFLLFGSKLQVYYLRRWKEFSYFLLFPKKLIYSFSYVFPHLILALDVSLSCLYLQMLSQKYKVKTVVTPLTSDLELWS